MERLIHDLLDVTKAEQGKLSIRRDPVDPTAVARDVAASHEPIAASKRIAFETSVADALPQVCGDGDRLAQALTNLIGNAFKFTPPGGVVRLSVAQRDGKVRFEVSDSGPGIAPSDLPHLFEPFWQAKKTAHLGAGLGLKITRAIAEAHDGSIEVTNLAGGGACFRLELPAMER
jgi:signal transduction histidine kinase